MEEPAFVRQIRHEGDEEGLCMFFVHLYAVYVLDHVVNLEVAQCPRYYQIKTELWL